MATVSSVEKDLDIAIIDIDSYIKKICASSDEVAEASSRVGGISLDILKSVAVALNINKSQSKKQLIQAIKLKVQNKERLKVLEIVDMEKIAGGTFSKDQNTFSRLCNF